MFLQYRSLQAYLHSVNNSLQWETYLTIPLGLLSGWEGESIGATHSVCPPLQLDYIFSSSTDTHIQNQLICSRHIQTTKFHWQGSLCCRFSSSMLNVNVASCLSYIEVNIVYIQTKWALECYKHLILVNSRDSCNTFMPIAAFNFPMIIVMHNKI